MRGTELLETLGLTRFFLCFTGVFYIHSAPQT